MSMDLVTDDGKVFSFNWTGWGMMRDLLEELGEDTSEMASLNDGDPICGGTLLSWAQAIEQNLDALESVKIPDSRYVGGVRTAIRLGYDGDLDPEDRQWLSEFAKFCRAADGVQQW